MIKKELIGQTARIYQKPVTHEDYEGDAIITGVQFMDESEARAYCEVKFLDDGDERERFVNFKDVDRTIQ